MAVQAIDTTVATSKLWTLQEISLLSLKNYIGRTYEHRDLFIVNTYWV
jgi:hypothetical protein